MHLRIVHKALYQEVADRLREQIAAGVLAPGAWIDEQALTEQFGISRTPLREALKVLVAEGLVRLEARRGCFVNQLTERDLDEIFPLMALLEGRCAYEAARNACKADLKRLEQLHARLGRQAEAGEIDAYYATNALIHRGLQDLAGNRWLSGAIDDLRRVLRLSRQRSLHLPGRLRESLREHRAIFAAVQARDAEEAERVMRMHLLNQRAALAKLASMGETKRPRAAGGR
jgi:DNA-binding GntR family transcriptional regulator